MTKSELMKIGARELDRGTASVPCADLLADAFTVTIRNTETGESMVLDALLARQLCLRLEAFGNDCSPWCKRVRRRIRRMINQCSANVQDHAQRPAPLTPKSTK